MSKLPTLGSLPSVGKTPVKSSLPSLKQVSTPLPSLGKTPVKSSLPTVKSSLPSVKSSLPKKQTTCGIPPPPIDTVKDPRKYIDTYFGIRNGIEGNPVEGINYDIETLSYMLSTARADDMTDIIIDKMKELKNPFPFPIVECCSSIGGSTMGFLEDAFSSNPSISSVTAYECVPERREMLWNNAKMYGFDKRNILKVPTTPFEGVPKDLSNAVMTFDPPWLSEEIKGHQSTKDQYILSGITLGDKTLEEWILDCSHCSLIVIRVPPGYKLGPVPGFMVEKLLIKNSLLLIIYPIDKTVKQKKKIEKTNYETWKNNLKNFLRNNLLPKAITNPDILDKMVSEEAMEVWATAFTSESVNPNIGENYEEFELLGDKMLGAAYVRFMMSSYPDITRSQLSELVTFYLAKGFQAKLSASLGIGNHILSNFQTTTHMLEDVFESFVGGLSVVGDMIKFGVGFGLVYNFVVNLYSPLEVDWLITLGNPKTRVKEIYEALGIIRPIEKEKVPETFTEDSQGNVTFSVIMPANGLEILRQLGIPIVSNIVSTYTDNTKKKASDAAYRLAVANLNNLGITDEWISEIRKRRELENPELAPYIATIKRRLGEEGYSDFYFVEKHVKSKIGGKTTGKYIQLIGVESNGRKKILSLTKDPVELVLEGKKQVLQKYASYTD